MTAAERFELGEQVLHDFALRHGPLDEGQVRRLGKLKRDLLDGMVPIANREGDAYGERWFRQTFKSRAPGVLNE